MANDEASTADPKRYFMARKGIQMLGTSRMLNNKGDLDPLCLVDNALYGAMILTELSIPEQAYPKRRSITVGMNVDMVEAMAVSLQIPLFL